jgi:hypothetical protein
MEIETWLKSEVGYGEELIRAAVTGARSAQEKAFAEEPAVLRCSARGSLPWAVIGASMGLVALYWGSRRKSAQSAAAFALLGAVVGFSTNMAFSTRQLTGKTVRGAMKNINTVRDAHWLAKNPIDYA